jgi:hypothetical protein
VGDNPREVHARSDDLLAPARDGVIAASGDFWVSQGELANGLYRGRDVTPELLGGAYRDIGVGALESFQSRRSNYFQLMFIIAVVGLIHKACQFLIMR